MTPNGLESKVFKKVFTNNLKICIMRKKLTIVKTPRLTVIVWICIKYVELYRNAVAIHCQWTALFKKNMNNFIP